MAHPNSEELDRLAGGSQVVWLWDYEDRRRKLKLPTLVYRRPRGDITNVYKYINKIYDTESSILPLEQNYWARGHQMKLKKHHTNTNIMHFFFTQQVTKWWNGLRKEVIVALSVTAFKNHLDHHFENHPVKFNYKALDNPSWDNGHHDFSKELAFLPSWREFTPVHSRWVVSCPVQPRACHCDCVFHTFSVAWNKWAGQLAAGVVASVWGQWVPLWVHMRFPVPEYQN